MLTLFTYFRVADGRRSLVLVVFIGGVTYAEISALRFLSAQVCQFLVHACMIYFEHYKLVKIIVRIIAVD